MDIKTKEFLVLIVELYQVSDGFIYSYLFQIFDENGGIITKRLYSRNESDKYLPQEIKPKIIPLVKEMTINLVNRIKPDIINRISMEKLNDKSIIRYNEISQLLENELGYKLLKQWKDEHGRECWKFIRNGIEMDLNDSTIEEEYNFFSSSIGKNLLNAEKKLNESIRKTPLSFK